MRVGQLIKALKKWPADALVVIEDADERNDLHIWTIYPVGKTCTIEGSYKHPAEAEEPDCIIEVPR
jgi:hypothetical protein